MCEIEYFNIWLLEGLAYQLTQRFITCAEKEESCVACMWRLISAWSHLVGLLPDTNTSVPHRLKNWTILCDLITFSYVHDIEHLELLVPQVEEQKCQMKVSDDIGAKALQFLHTKVTLYHFEQQNIRKARSYMQKNNVLYADEVKKLLNPEGNSSIPEVLEMKNLQSHIIPYIQSVTSALGKPKFFKTISNFENEKMRQKSDEARALIDNLVSEYISCQAQNITNNTVKNAKVNTEEKNASQVERKNAPQEEIHCTEVSSSQGNDIPLVQPATSQCSTSGVSNINVSQNDVDFVKVGTKQVDKNVCEERRKPSSPGTVSKASSSPGTVSKASSLTSSHTLTSKMLESMDDNEQSSVGKNTTVTVEVLDGMGSSLNNSYISDIPEGSESHQTVTSNEPGGSKDSPSTMSEVTQNSNISPVVVIKSYTLRNGLPEDNSAPADNSETSPPVVKKTEEPKKNPLRSPFKKPLRSPFKSPLRSPSKSPLKPNSKNAAKKKRLFAGQPLFSKTPATPPPPGTNKRKRSNTNESVEIVDGTGESLVWTSDEEGTLHPVLNVNKPLQRKDRPKPAKLNNSRVKFTMEEERYVIEGVETYGFGNWRTILENYPFHLSRTNVSIKDKYRTLVKNGVIGER